MASKRVRSTLATSPELTARYRQRFVDFTKLELASGGPDHHLTTIGHLARETPHPSWTVGCYVVPYNIPGGLAILDAWPDPTEVIPNHSLVERWFAENWAGLPIRKECRPRRSPAKMAAALVSYANWDVNVFQPAADYETIWKSTTGPTGIRYCGRYATTKLLEGLHRADVTAATVPDIRAGRGGDWSPRQALSHLYPEYDELLNRDSSRAGAARVEDLVRLIFPGLQGVVGIPDIYNLEVLLCDFNQHVKGQYTPGKPLDSELVHLEKVRSWPSFRRVNLTRVLELRSELFPHEFLGELNGWNGRREELGKTYDEHGYVWTDALYDYAKTTDLSQPVPR